MQFPNANNEWRECPKQTVTGMGKFNRQLSGGPDCWAYCVLELGLLPRGQGFVFKNLIAKDEMPISFVTAIENDVITSMQEGVAKEYPIVDVYVALVDATIHEVDSGDRSFQRAGVLAFQDACSKAEMVILEPMATVTITTPKQFADSIQADLKQRRGEILRHEALLNHSCVLEASVPLGETLGYAAELSQRTDDSVQVTIIPNGYAEVSADIADALRAARKANEPEKPAVRNLPIQRFPKRKKS